MSHDFDEESGRGRSRRNPKVSDGNGRSRRSRMGHAGAKKLDSGLSFPELDEVYARRKKKRRRMIVMILAEILTLACIFGYGFWLRLTSQIQKPDEEVIAQITTNEDINVASQERMTGYWTIAVFGVDARDSAIQKSTNSDVIIICSINLETGEIRLVSVYRDSYLNIDESGSYNKINQAYFVGGAGQAVSALNRNLDLNITDFVTFNWKAVAQGINVLGGVDVELSKAEFYYINSFITETVKATGIGSTQLTHAGENHLDGVQAVAYGRLRLMDTDYARTERQRKIIQLAFEKAQQSDFQTLYTLIGTVFPNVYTSLWVDDLVSNAKNISLFHLTETTGFPQARGEANMGKKGAVVVPATLESNVKKLHEFLYDDEDYEPSDTVKKISANISSDTGIYKEGQYVDHVGTDGGVIQTQKSTTAASESTSSKSTSSSDEEDEEEESSENSTKDSTEKNSSDSSTEAETDEEGRPLSTSGVSLRPGATTQAADDDEEADADDADADEDDDDDETDEEDEEDQQPQTVDRPGAASTTTTAAATSPSSAASPTSQTTDGPNSTTGTTAATTAASSTTTAVSSGPGGLTEETTAAVRNGVVSAPGQ
ncbi:MAG: LCP family protein [Clostridiales bacterium]|nr:LCP family protein [Clostridiales bacterium]